MELNSKERQVPRIIRYVNYNKDRDPENYYPRTFDAFLSLEK